jgi:hypothetical protein
MPEQETGIRKSAFLVRNSTWEKIRDFFDEDEKAELQMAVRGQTICPPGVIVDLDELHTALARKLNEKYAGAGR